MNWKLTIAISVLLTAGCSSQSTTEMTTVDDSVAVSGQAAYEQYCASCHDTGKGGAPIVGRKSDWVDRSKLWQAILVDHAKTGYLDMPAKGGTPEVPDKTLDAAVDYMLERTHEHLPADQ